MHLEPPILQPCQTRDKDLGTIFLCPLSLSSHQTVRCVLGCIGVCMDGKTRGSPRPGICSHWSRRPSMASLPSISRPVFPLGFPETGDRNPSVPFGHGNCCPGRLTAARRGQVLLVFFPFILQIGSVFALVCSRLVGTRSCGPLTTFQDIECDAVLGISYPIGVPSWTSWLTEQFSHCSRRCPVMHMAALDKTVRLWE